MATRLVHVTTIPLTAKSFLTGQLRWYRQQGFDVTLASSPGQDLRDFGRQEGIHVRPLALTRSISPIRDLKSLSQCVQLFREVKPDIVHAHTPKAGLVAMVAARRLGIPVRIYHLHGLRFETETGIRRKLLLGAERLACSSATDILSVSHSVRRAAMHQKLCRRKPIQVLHNGSINGLDSSRFCPERAGLRLRRQTRQELGIPADAIVLGFVGRIVRDKGIRELMSAWQQLRAEFSQLQLLLVGAFESGGCLPEGTLRELHPGDRVHMPGWNWKTERYYAAMDVLTLPSYREGMAYSLLEAASMGLPTVTSQVTGCIDAIVDGRTGTAVPCADVPALIAAIGRYLRDPQLRKQHGLAGRDRIVRDFKPQDIWAATFQHYQRSLATVSGSRRVLKRAA